MSTFLVIFFFLPTFYERNSCHCQGKLLRVRLIIKNDRILTFSFKKLINSNNIHTALQDKKNVMSNMSFLILIYFASYLLTQENIFILTKNYTHFD